MYVLMQRSTYGFVFFLSYYNAGPAYEKHFTQKTYGGLYVLTQTSTHTYAEVYMYLHGGLHLHVLTQRSME